MQRTDTKRRDAVSHLVKGDQTARNRSSDSGQFFLARADGQRQQRRAAQARQSKSQNAHERFTCRNERDEDEGNRHDQGQGLVSAVLGDPSSDGGKENTPAGYGTPE